LHKLYYLRGTSGKKSKVKARVGPRKAAATTPAMDIQPKETASEVVSTSAEE
jgi:hypothetical protein